MLLVNPEPVVTSASDLGRPPPGVWRFRAFLPEVPGGNIVTLGEGGTPLLPARRLGAEVGLDNLAIKDETMNPTGSFMDRGSTVLVSLAKGMGVSRFSCATTGNLGASLAAYSARAGIETRIRISPNIDRGKLYQMIMYGSKVELSSSSADDEDGSDTRSRSISAANPFILEGEKTTGFEILQDEDWVQPDAIVLPVGTGGHITMMWRSLLEMRTAGLIPEPASRLIGVQLRASSLMEADAHQEKNRTEGRRTIHKGRDRRTAAPIELEESEPIFRKAAERSIRTSGGDRVEVSPKEVIQGMSLLAKTEGIFAEPAGASVIASLKLAKDRGLLRRSDRIVCVVTGAGLKDTRAISRIAKPAASMMPSEDFMIRPLEVGTTKLRIMRLLSVGPSFGYVVWKSLSKEGRITTASVYQHLSELERASLVRRSRVVRFKGRERMFYELTRKGSELLKALTKSR